jgi:hypothetical protein
MLRPILLGLALPAARKYLQEEHDTAQSCLVSGNFSEGKSRDVGVLSLCPSKKEKTTMHFYTGNGIGDEIVIVFFLVLSCGFGWWMRNSQVRTLQSEVNRLKNVEKLCHRLWVKLLERDEQLSQYTDPPRQLAPPLRKSEQSAGLRDAARNTSIGHGAAVKQSDAAPSHKISVIGVRG